MNLYSKQALITSTGFTPIERDILTIVLNDDRQYSLIQAKNLVRKFKEAF